MSPDASNVPVTTKPVEDVEVISVPDMRVFTVLVPFIDVAAVSLAIT